MITEFESADRLNDFPIQVRLYCELIHASGCAREEASETFQEKRKRIAEYLGFQA